MTTDTTEWTHADVMVASAHAIAADCSDGHLSQMEALAEWKEIARELLSEEALEEMLGEAYLAAEARQEAQDGAPTPTDL